MQEIILRIEIGEDTREFLRKFFGTPDPKTVNKILNIVKEIRSTMATKEELNTALDQIVTNVTKLGEDLAAHLADLGEQIAAGNDVSDSLAKAQDIATRLQVIDETVPERTPAPVEG
jgi:hypothetical protein